jgi:hypothetical protein
MITTRKVLPRLLPATVGVASFLVAGCGVFLGKDVRVEVSEGVTGDALRKIQTVGVAYSNIPGGTTGWVENTPPAVFLRRLAADLEKGGRFKVVKEEAIWRAVGETKSNGWEERFMAAARKAGADGLIKTSMVFYSASAFKMRRGGGVAQATAELISLAGSTLIAKVSVTYQSPGAAIEEAASALAEAIHERISGGRAAAHSPSATRTGIGWRLRAGNCSHNRLGEGAELAA